MICYVSKFKSSIIFASFWPKPYHMMIEKFDCPSNASQRSMLLFIHWRITREPFFILVVF